MIDFCFFFESCIIGGTEILIEKLGNYYNLNGNRVVLFCRDIIPEMQRRFEAKKIEVVRVNFWNNTRLFASAIKENTHGINVFCITFNWQCYTCVARTTSVPKKTILFSTHPDTLRTDLSYSASNLCLKFASILNFHDLIKKHRLVVQDEQTIKAICKCFGDKYKKDLEDLIIRIPVDIPPLNFDRLSLRAKEKRLKILTIARADFPFKGYILGLIELMKTFVEAQLTIISYGPNEAEIKKSICNLPDDVSIRIKLVGQTDFDSLENFIQESNLYIGMGTTVLDATLRGVLSIAVYSYTFDLVADDFFFNDVLSIIGYKHDDSCNNKINNLINQFYKMNEFDYYQNAIKGRNSVINYYSTKAVAENIIQRFNGIIGDSKNFSSWVLTKFFHLRFKISNIMHRREKRQIK